MDYQNISANLIGNATHDAEVKTAKESGNQYADFRLAVKNKKRETTYFPIRVFGKLAEGVAIIKKGTKVFVAGDLELSSFTGEEGGKRMMFRVLADTYTILDGGRKLARQQNPAKTPSTPQLNMTVTSRHQWADKGSFREANARASARVRFWLSAV